jgi:hypothetical protein
VPSWQWQSGKKRNVPFIIDYVRAGLKYHLHIQSSSLARFGVKFAVISPSHMFIVRYIFGVAFNILKTFVPLQVYLDDIKSLLFSVLLFNNLYCIYIYIYK